MHHEQVFKNSDLSIQNQIIWDNIFQLAFVKQITRKVKILSISTDI